MARIINSRSVLAVRDLELSTKYYIDVLGFRKDPIDAPGWSFLSRDTFRVMLGECGGAQPAGELGDHSYFGYWNVDAIDDFPTATSTSGRRPPGLWGSGAARRAFRT